MNPGERGPSQDNLVTFTVALDWIFFQSGGIRKEMIQFILPDQVTHTRFEVNGQYLKQSGQVKFRVLSIFSEHDLEFLNTTNSARLRAMLKDKIDAHVAPTFVPNLALDIVTFGEIRHVS
jgi:hypothetical protein